MARGFGLSVSASPVTALEARRPLGRTCDQLCSRLRPMHLAAVRMLTCAPLCAGGQTCGRWTGSAVAKWGYLLADHSPQRLSHSYLY